jgi:hypothetical protein
MSQQFESQQYEAYIAAKSDHDASEHEVATLIARLKAFAGPLIKNWRECHIEIGGELQQTDAAKAKHTVDGHDVPRPEEISRAMNKYFDARKRADLAWKALRPQERKQLKPPSWEKSKH